MTESNDKPKGRRRGRGEGSISKVPGRDLWRARIAVGRDPSGKYIRKTVYGKTKREVTDALTRIQNQKLDGRLLAVDRMTVDDLLTRWLEFWATDIQASTKREYEKIAKRYLRPRLGSIDIAKLQAAHVQNLMDKLTQEKVGARTRQYVFATLRRALNSALDRDLIISNPCRRAIAPKHKAKEASALTSEQARELIAVAAGTRWEALMILAVATGMRQGELFGLAWTDIDFTESVITVRHSLQEIDGKLTLKQPKSESGRRVIALDAGTVEALHNHRRLMMAEGNAASPWVFCSPEGGWLRKSNFFRSAWKPIRKDAGLESLRFHELRHTHITWLIDDNVPLKEVQVQAGHSTPQMVMRYAHRTKHSQAKALAAITSRMTEKESCNHNVTTSGETDGNREAS